MEDYKNKVEAILFSSGKKMAVEDIAKLCRTNAETVTQSLRGLKEDYDTRDSSVLLVEESDGWKLTVHEKYSPIVRKIVTDTELSKTMMETLAVIAWKAPVLQSDIIKVRTNKAYDHLDNLETSGFITRQKHGRTKIIRLTERFFNYFDVKNTDEMKSRFKIKQEQTTLPVPQKASQQEAPQQVTVDEEPSATKE
jgi:segregation and condensation protein B